MALMTVYVHFALLILILFVTILLTAFEGLNTDPKARWRYLLLGRTNEVLITEKECKLIIIRTEAALCCRRCRDRDRYGNEIELSDLLCLVRQRSTTGELEGRGVEGKVSFCFLTWILIK